MRARLALVASEVQVELREVVLRAKPAAMLNASPKGTVPVLVLPEGQVVDESLDIMLWALRRNDPLSWLNAGGAVRLEEMLDLIKACDTYFKPRLDRYKYPPRYPDADPSINRDEAAAWLKQLDERLVAQPYLFADHASLADMAIAPFVRQFAHTDKEWFNTQNWPGLLRWLDAWMESNLFEQVMHKYKPWDESASGEVFPTNRTGAS